MIKKLKKITVRAIEGANAAACLAMLLTGYAGLFNPELFPRLSMLSMAFPVTLIVNLCFLIFWLTVRWRSAWIAVLGFIVVLQPLRTYLPINFGDKPPTGSVKVLTYNVQGFTGAPRYKENQQEAVSLIINYIKEQDADIVCIQEAMDGKRKALERLDSLYPYHDMEKLGTSASNGMCIYTRYPIKRKEKIDYPSKANGSAAYYLDIDGREVIVVNNHFESNHLTLTDRNHYAEMVKGEMGHDTLRLETRRLFDKLTDAVKDRAPQARAVRQYLERHASQPIIFCGDLNDNPLSYAHRQIAQVLTDCHTTTALGPGISYNQKKFYVRIDNIMCSESITPYRCHVDRSIDASDHYPMVCWLKIGKNE